MATGWSSGSDPLLHGFLDTTLEDNMSNFGTTMQSYNQRSENWIADADGSVAYVCGLSPLIPLVIVVATPIVKLG